MEVVASEEPVMALAGPYPTFFCFWLTSGKCIGIINLWDVRLVILLDYIVYSAV